jgi:hypothetical protein
MTARKWPSRRRPPPGWVVSPELSEIYGYNVIVREGEQSRVRRTVDRDPALERMGRSGRRGMALGAALMAMGIYLRR